MWDTSLYHSDFDQTEEELTCVSAAWPQVKNITVIKAYFNNCEWIVDVTVFGLGLLSSSQFHILLLCCHVWSQKA